MQYCPAKASTILQNEWHCPADIDRGRCKLIL